jgi:hypothetical protein
LGEVVLRRTSRGLVIEPAEVFHELLVVHVAEFGVVLKGCLDGLAFVGTHAHVSQIARLDQLSVDFVH